MYLSDTTEEKPRPLVVLPDWLQNTDRKQPQQDNLSGFQVPTSDL